MEKRKSKTREYIESIVIAALIALVVRSFVIQAYKIPSGSMEPTLLVGDHLLVNRMSYVIKMPFVDTVLFSTGKPQRGDIIVFRYPEDPSKDYIKRVIATEGESVEIKNKAVFINGRKINDTWGHFRPDSFTSRGLLPFIDKDNIPPITVPKDSYFVMGDNRDNSLDSRYWGFVQKQHLVGKALIIYFSWDSNAMNALQYVRWSRVGWLIK
ncbi:MAG TPA: signal peptidase I [Deltaproteobacteria bacterium]|nr:signal peptidase I [Deltaproteobacteria bacterium]